MDVLQQTKHLTPDLKQVKHLDITVEIRTFNSEEKNENSFMHQVFGHFWNTKDELSSHVTWIFSCHFCFRTKLYYFHSFSSIFPCSFSRFSFKLFPQSPSVFPFKLLPQSCSKKSMTLDSPSEKIILLIVIQNESLTLIRNTGLLEYWSIPRKVS